MEPIVAAAASGMERLVDILFTVAEAGLNRVPYKNKVRELEAKGATADEISDALQEMRHAQDAATDAKIDAMEG